MATLQQVLELVDELTVEDLERLSLEVDSRLHCDDDDDWDRQMRRDVADGKFIEVRDSVRADWEAGRTFPVPLPE